MKKNLYYILIIVLFSSCNGDSDESVISPLLKITDFSFPAALNTALSTDVTGMISNTNITCTVPYGTDTSALIASFTITGNAVTVNGVTQISGVTSNNFSNPVDYCITAEDGSFQINTVIVEPWNIMTVDADGWTGDSSSIAINGSNIYISYRGTITTAPLNNALKLAKSADGGDIWTTSILDSDATGDNSSIAVDSSDIYISYEHDDCDLMFTKSTDGGASWSEILNLDTTMKCDSDTSIAVDGNNIYISYQNNDNDLMFTKSTDGGATWPTTVTIDSEGIVGDYSSIAVEGSNVYISYYDGSGYFLKFAKSIDGGATWPTILTVDSDGDLGMGTSIAVDGSNVYISYDSDSSWSIFSLNDLKFAKSTDGGITWTTSTVDSEVSLSEYTSMVVNGNNIYISYCDHYTVGDLRFARSTDGGLNWVISLVDTDGNVGYHPSMAINGSKVYISYYNSGWYDTVDTDRNLKFAKIDGEQLW